MATTAVTAIVDETLSHDASEILAGIGMTVDQALKLLLTQVVNDRCLPFALHIPNEETIAAMNELERGEGKHYASVDDLFHDQLAGDRSIQPVPQRFEARPSPWP